MNFQEFKNEFEERLKEKITFELLEFIYQPYLFGSGVIVFRINGYIYRIIYDGRDNNLILERSKPHLKYSKSIDWLEVLPQEKLSAESIENIARVIIGS